MGLKVLTHRLHHVLVSHPRDILISLQAAARKSLSQNFLTSPHWADRLTEFVTDMPDADEFWEIGPGLGALTARLLAKTDRPIRVFEYDRKLAEYLRQTYPKVQVVEGDFLEVDMKATAPEAKRIGVLSNLPYHLSSPILFKLLEQKPRFPRLVLTFQKEFAERLVAAPRTHDYGALSVLAQLHFKIASLGVLSPGAFYPMPAISSEALLLEPKEPVGVGLAHVSHVVKAAFVHRRKKMISNLKQAYPKAPLEEVFGLLRLSTSVRPEELTKEQYVALTIEIKPHICLTVCES